MSFQIKLILHNKFFFLLLFFFGVFFYNKGMASGFNHIKEPLHGILVEGIDCSGKSTVCKLLEEKFRKRGLEPKLNHCYLSDNYLIRFLLKKSIEFEGTEDEAIYHACATILDQFLFKIKPEAFYIQDRNWLSQACWLKFFCPEQSYAPKNYIFNNHQKFKWNVYLTVSHEIFKERYKLRSNNSKLDRLLFENQEIFIKYNDFFLTQFPADEGWVVINTDFLSPDQVADQILEHCNIK